MSQRHDARLVQIFRGAGATEDFAHALVHALHASGLEVADAAHDELVTRWVNVNERAVPPDADTIIRTITRTSGERTDTSTHWLDGLRGPRIS
jgi:hypothetical protein